MNVNPEVVESIVVPVLSGLLVSAALWLIASNKLLEVPGSFVWRWAKRMAVGLYRRVVPPTPPIMLGRTWLQYESTPALFINGKVACPHCHGHRFIEGPSGGMSTNVLCENCKHWWNGAIGHHLPWEFIRLDESYSQVRIAAQLAQRRATGWRWKLFGVPKPLLGDRKPFTFAGAWARWTWKW